jgi:hypothetical protein
MKPQMKNEPQRKAGLPPKPDQRDTIAPSG